MKENIMLKHFILLSIFLFCQCSYIGIRYYSRPEIQAIRDCKSIFNECWDDDKKLYNSIIYSSKQKNAFQTEGEGIIAAVQIHEEVLVEYAIGPPLVPFIPLFGTKSGHGDSKPFFYIKDTLYLSIAFKVIDGTNDKGGPVSFNPCAISFQKESEKPLFPESYFKYTGKMRALSRNDDQLRNMPLCQNRDKGVKSYKANEVIKILVRYRINFYTI